VKIKGVVIGVLSLNLLFWGGASTGAESNQNIDVVEADKIIEQNNLERTSNDEVSVEELSEQYGLKDADLSEVEPGTNAINFDTEEELAIFLEDVNKETSSEEFVVSEETVDAKLNPNFAKASSLVAAAGSSKRTVKRAVEHIGAFGDINIEADFYVSGSGSFYWISSVQNIRTYASGFTWPFDWTQTGKPYGSISSNKQSATAYASGTVDYLLFVKGIGKWYSRAVNCDVSYSINR
jgi:hypothetical protein